MTVEIAMQEIAKSMENAKLSEIAKNMPDLNTNVADLDKSMVKDVKKEIAFNSTYAERWNRTPKDHGQWLGERGESMFISDNPEVTAILEVHGLEGITYHNAIPDFSGVAKAEVTIENMTNDRKSSMGNFKQADMALAKQMGCDGRDISNWRDDNGYTWHECNDLETCQLVPISINSTFGHLGGVGEYNSMLWEGDIFDE